MGRRGTSTLHPGYSSSNAKRQERRRKRCQANFQEEKMLKPQLLWGGYMVAGHVGINKGFSLAETTLCEDRLMKGLG